MSAAEEARAHMEALGLTEHCREVARSLGPLSDDQVAAVRRILGVVPQGSEIGARATLTDKD
jgi:hypothetical protein